MAIVTISRQAGSLGDEIAKATAERLGYDLIEKSQISESLSRYGFSLTDIDKFDEKKPSVWLTLSMQNRLFEHFIQAAVYELATQKNVVIVGRGGQVILKDIPNTLHVRVIAPYATRVSRIMELRGYEENIAERLVRQSDRDSSGYLSTYFDTHPDDSDLYDLVINTRSLGLEESVELIAAAATAEAVSKGPQISEVLFDRALDQKAKAALLQVNGAEGAEVDVEKGVASLSGLIRSASVKSSCEQVVAEIQGMKSVDNHLSVLSDNKSIF